MSRNNNLFCVKFFGKCLVIVYAHLRLRSTPYRIMQIVRGGKASQLHDLLVIHGKTFAIV